VGAEEIAELYVRHWQRVYQRARRLLKDAEAARDATQEVFLRAASAKTAPIHASDSLAWLYRTTTNLCLNGLRDARRRGELLSLLGPEAARSADADARMAVSRILEALPQDLRDVAIYYYVDEFSHEEIAGLLNVSRRTVGNRLAAFHELVSGFLSKEIRE
jgi:RNA polymerase sigma-70 factor, ECF subfamily